MYNDIYNPDSNQWYPIKSSEGKITHNNYKCPNKKKKNIYIVHGPFRSGKTFLCNQIKENTNILTIDLDQFTKRYVDDYIGNIGNIRIDIQMEIELNKDINDIVFCGACIILQKGKIEQIFDEESFPCQKLYKFYLDSNIIRLYENVILTRMEITKITKKESKILLHKQIGYKKGPPSQIYKLFKIWYNNSMKNQRLCTTFDRNREIAEERDYEFIKSGKEIINIVQSIAAMDI